MMRLVNRSDHATKAIVRLVSPGHPGSIIGDADVPHVFLSHARIKASITPPFTHVAAFSSIRVVVEIKAWETGRWCFTYVFWCTHCVIHQQSRRNPEKPTPLSIVPATIRLVVAKGTRLHWSPRRDEDSVSLHTC